MCNKRLFDILMAILILTIFFPLMLIIGILVGFSSRGPIFFKSSRIGRANKVFLMYKYRTMVRSTPLLASHLLPNTANYVTKLGGFLRKTSLDELPQLWNILIGEMSFVGPRPALFNQDDLITFRSQYGVDQLMPGLTGWAQVNGRDELSIQIKVQFEVEYLLKQSFWFDMKILGLTFLKVVRRAGVSH